MEPSHSRLAHIDALRGIAALLVVWQHSSEVFALQPAIAANGTLLADIAWTIDAGRIGVVCFFLISGFVIPYSFSSGRAPIATFTIRRLFRLYPAYWLSIAGVALLGSLLFDRAPNTAVMVTNMTMLQQFFGVPHIQGLYWTLTLELVFYVICALLYWRGLLFNPKVLAGAVLSVAVIFAVVQVVTRVVPSFQEANREMIYLIFCIGFMFLGALLRQYYDQPSQPIKRLCWLATAALLIFPLASLAAYLLSDIDLRFLRFGASYLLAFIVFITGLYVIRLRSRLLIWLGAISYSVYLFHHLAIMCVTWALQQAWAKGLDNGPISVYMAAVLVITLITAHCVYRWVELPAIAWGRTLSRRFSQPVSGTINTIKPKL